MYIIVVIAYHEEIDNYLCNIQYGDDTNTHSEEKLIKLLDDGYEYIYSDNVYIDYFIESGIGGDKAYPTNINLPLLKEVCEISSPLQYNPCDFEYRYAAYVLRFNDYPNYPLYVQNLYTSLDFNESNPIPEADAEMLFRHIYNIKISEIYKPRFEEILNTKLNIFVKSNNETYKTINLDDEVSSSIYTTNISLYINVPTGYFNNLTENDVLELNDKIIKALEFEKDTLNCYITYLPSDDLLSQGTSLDIQLTSLYGNELIYASSYGQRPIMDDINNNFNYKPAVIFNYTIIGNNVIYKK